MRRCRPLRRAPEIMTTVPTPTATTSHRYRTALGTRLPARKKKRLIALKSTKAAPSWAITAISCYYQLPPQLCPKRVFGIRQPTVRASNRGGDSTNLCCGRLDHTHKQNGPSKKEKQPANYYCRCRDHPRWSIWRPCQRTRGGEVLVLSGWQPGAGGPEQARVRSDMRPMAKNRAGHHRHPPDALWRVRVRRLAVRVRQPPAEMGVHTLSVR